LINQSLVRRAEWGHMPVGDSGEVIAVPYLGSDDPPTLFFPFLFWLGMEMITIYINN